METVVGLFEHKQEAKEAIARLVGSGFRRDMIKLLSRDRLLRERLGGIQHEVLALHGRAGAGGGGVFGAILGLIAGLYLLAAQSAAALLIVGGVLLICALSSGIGAAIGQIVGKQDGLRVAPIQPATYAHGVQPGGLLVCVYASGDCVQQALRIMEQANAAGTLAPRRS